MKLFLRLQLTTIYKKKFKVYERFGVKEYWIVDPEDKSVQILILKDSKFVLDQEAIGAEKVSSRILSGFVVHLNSIFEEQ